MALMQLVAGMEALVSLQCGHLREALWAQVALIRSFARVNPDVFVQI